MRLRTELSEKMLAGEIFNQHLNNSLQIVNDIIVDKFKTKETTDEEVEHIIEEAIRQLDYVKNNFSD